MKFNFKILSNQIQETHNLLRQSAVTAINKHITIRNWLIGFYIFEYEQKGEDRAKYGDKLLHKLEIELTKKGLKGFTESNLYRFKNFYLIYQSISATLSQKSTFPDLNLPISATLSQKFNSIPARLSANSPSSNLNKSANYYSQLLSQTSFSHFVELIKIDDEVKRSYYELLILHTQPSVRDLRRQIDTLAFERTNLSKNKKLSLKSIANKITPTKSVDAIKDFYFLDFLELQNHTYIDEQVLETALLDKLQKFILELGNGFCFEARQKRILIGEQEFYIDLVFYHRILKCHVIVELKVDEFSPAHASQLRTYIKHYNKKIKHKTDNPTIGILLVANKNKTLAEYTLEGMDEKMFVSKYSIELPTKKQLESLIKKEIQNFD